MNRESWLNRAGFTLAAIGSAVGLASIVRFPYLVADHGGAAFIAVYLLSLFVIGVPVLLAEVALGRATEKNPFGAFTQKGGKLFWKGSGGWILLTALIVSSFYSAFSGWILGYLVEAFMGNLNHLHSPNLAQEHFSMLLGTPTWGVSYHFAFLLLSVGIVYAGLRNGIEKGCKVLMPLLFATLLLLVVQGLALNNSFAALEYLFKPDWSLITPATVLLALGQSFFTLSLGQGTMITYGSYLPKKTPFAGSCISVALSVVCVSILSAIAVFTIVYSKGIEPEGGLGLMFQTLPLVFSTMPGGQFLAIVFFLLVALAALTSEISALEPIIAYLVDEKGWKRRSAALATGTFAFAIGIPCALSTSLLSGWTLGGLNILELFDLVATTVLVPIGGLLGALLVGWRWGFKGAYDEIISGSKPWPIAGKAYLQVCVKYLAPALILLIFLTSFPFFAI